MKKFWNSNFLVELFGSKKEEAATAQQSSAKNQYLAAIVANLLFIGYGVTAGWSSPNIRLLTSDESPLPSGSITMEEASWVASLLCVGGVIGNLFFGFVTNAYGRKIPLIITAIPTIIAWILVWTAQNVYFLYAARVLNGFIGGGFFIIIPLYLNEIASDNVRGVLGSTVMFCYNIGMILAFVLGAYCEYGTTPKFVIGLTIFFTVSFYFFPETPTALIKQNKIPETEESIRFYQNRRGKANDSEFIQSEIKKLQKSINGNTKGANDEENSFNWSDVITGNGRKAMLIGLVLASLNQMCGCFAMLNYTAKIFEEAQSNLHPNTAAIVVGVIQVFGSCSATFLVDRAGRKFLFAVSTIGSALGLLVLGGYVFLKQMGVNVQPHNWIPVASFSFVIFIASWAILTLPYLVISEVLPEKLKDFGMSFCLTLVWSLSFLMVKLLPFLINTFGFHGTMFFFAGCCISSAIFIIIRMPETKNKSHDQIMELL